MPPARVGVSTRLMPSIRELAFTQAVVDLQGYYLLTVKENQPPLYTDLQTYFSDPEASDRSRADDRPAQRATRGAPDQGDNPDEWIPGAVARAGTSGSGLSAASRSLLNEVKKWSLSSQICRLSKPALIAY